MEEYRCDRCGSVYKSPQALAGHKTGCGNLPWDDPEMLRKMYHEDKMSVSEIAERWDDANREKVAWQFRKYGIETRTRGEGKRLESVADVSLSIIRGRMRLEFREFGDHIQIPLSRAIALSEWSLDELDGKHVHHKNGHPLDDRIENYEVLTNSEHQKRHDMPEGDADPERLRKLAESRERDDHGRFV